MYVLYLIIEKKIFLLANALNSLQRSIIVCPLGLDSTKFVDKSQETSLSMEGDV